MSETRSPAAERQAAYRQGVARRLSRIEQQLAAVAEAVAALAADEPEQRDARARQDHKEPKHGIASVP